MKHISVACASIARKEKKNNWWCYGYFGYYGYMGIECLCGCMLMLLAPLYASEGKKFN